MSELALVSILAKWGFDKEVNIKQEVIHYETDRIPHIWTIDEKYILKMTKSKQEIENHLYLSRLLLSVDIPVQSVMKTSTNEDYVKVDECYYGLFTKLQGEVLTGYEQIGGRYLGQCLAKLHRGLKEVTSELSGLGDNDQAKELSGWVKEALDCYLLQCELAENEIAPFTHIRTEVEEKFEELYVKLPRQVIHRDFHIGNMVFEAGQLVGYLDFDLSQVNARVFDLCYLCTGALSSYFNDPAKRVLWMDFVTSVILGYDQINPLTVDEKQGMKCMMISIELMMIAHFANNGYREIANLNIQMVNYIEASMK